MGGGCVMARIRTIKPEFWLNEDMATISPDAALLAIGLLNYADDEGYFNANPMLIRAAIFPIRQTKDIAKVLLPELIKIGYIEMLTDSDGRIYGVVSNFSVHQYINKPTPSKISCLELLRYDYGSGTVGLPTGKEGKGREGKGGAGEIGLDDLRIDHIAEWLAEKRKGGAYINHDPQAVLDGFKDYCRANGKRYKDYVAAYRNAFEWERFAPKQTPKSKEEPREGVIVC
jgi:hypothetical protein